MESLLSPELWIAVVSGGFGIKLIDVVMNLRRNRNSNDMDEKESLRKDIEYLRKQIEELRAEVNTLKNEVTKKDEYISFWQRRYWDKKLELDRVLVHVSHFGSPELKEKVRQALDSGDDIVDLTEVN